MDDMRIEFRLCGRRETFLCGPPSLLYSGYRVKHPLR